MTTLLTLLSAVAALLFLTVVAVALVRIVGLLDVIGGNHTSFLMKLRVGLRAIARHTSHIAPAAADLGAAIDDLALKLPRREQAAGNRADTGVAP